MICILRKQDFKISHIRIVWKKRMIKRIWWSNGLLCYGYKPAVSLLNWRAEHGKGKWKYSKGIFKIDKELEKAKY